MEPNTEQTAPLGPPPSFEVWKTSQSSSQQSAETNMRPPAGPPKPPISEDYNSKEGNDAGDPNDNLKLPSDEKNEKPISPDLNKLIGDANSMALKDRSILLDLLDHSPEKEQEFAKLLNMYDNMSEKDQEYFKNHLKK
jgi:hypothetical protein